MQQKRLDSWQSVADHFGRSIRTVQRWQIEHGLPIHHLPGPKGAVFAYTEELDSWMAASFGQNRLDLPLTGKEDESRKKRSLALTARANEFWEMRSEKNIHTEAKLFRDAIDEDPGNAAAFLGLANAVIVATFDGMVQGAMAYPRAAEALHRISLLASDSIDRKCTEAWLDLAWQRKWQRAGASFDEVLGMRRYTSFALSGRALLYVAEGKLAQAYSLALEAWKQNTFAHSLSSNLCWIAYLAADYKHSLQLSAEARIVGGYGATHAAIEALALIQSGSMAANVDRLESCVFEYPNDQTLQGALGYFYARSKQTEKAEILLESLGWTAARKPTGHDYGVALILLGLDKPQEAIQSLQASYAAGSRWSLGFRVDPLLKQLGSDSRFQDLCKKAGPPPEKRK